MSLGGGGGQKAPVYTGIQVQTSAYGLPVAFGAGRTRISWNLIWYNDFQKHKDNQGGKGGGKGGGYTYTAAVEMALGWGVIASIPTVYMDQNTITDLAKAGLTLLTGTPSQTAPSFIVTKYPAQADSYPNIAYLFSEALDLGSSATVPSLGFEAVLQLSGTMPGTDDINLADFIPLLLTSPLYGMGLSSGDYDATTLANYKDYTQAQGLFFSPWLSSPEKATDIIDRYARLSNSWIFFSGTKIKFVPLGDVALSANGATYTPDVAARFDFTADDFQNKDEPIKITVADQRKAFNKTVLNIKDRAIHYNTNPIDWPYDTLINKFGLNQDSNSSADEICDAVVGKTAAALIAKRNAFLRNSYEFAVDYRADRLEPGDLGTITHPFLTAINRLPVRIVSIDEDENGNNQIVAEEWTGVLGAATALATETNSSVTVDQLVDPGDVNDPCIFEPNSALAGAPEVWIAASGGADWGGAFIYVSLDGGTTYSKIGTITASAKQGLLTATLASHADPDAINTLAVDNAESGTTLEPASHADADAFRTLMYLTAPSSGGVVPSVGELVAYGTVTPTGTYSADLTYLRRALYGSAAASHSSGANATLLDLTGATGSLIRYDLPAAYVGQTIHVKFAAFNIFGLETQDLSGVTDYTYTPLGTGFGSGTSGVPGQPATPTATAGTSQNLISWAANPVTDNVTAYQVWRASGTGASFGSAAMIASVGTATSYADTGVTLGAGYTYFVVAVNAAGSSIASLGANCTSGSGQVLALRPTGSLDGTYTSSQVLMNIPMKTGDALPVSLTGSLLYCTVAPTGSITVTLSKVVSGTPSTIATGTIAAGQTTGSWTAASPVTFSETTHDRLELTAPVTIDATLAGLGWLLMGTRTQ